MGKKETDRLLEEACKLIDSSALPEEEKENLRNNIEHFLSSVSKDSYVKDALGPGSTTEKKITGWI